MLSAKWAKLNTKNKEGSIKDFLTQIDGSICKEMNAGNYRAHVILGKFSDDKIGKLIARECLNQLSTIGYNCSMIYNKEDEICINIAWE